MAIPVILAETIAITELYLLFTRNLVGRIKTTNKIDKIKKVAILKFTKLLVLKEPATPPIARRINPNSE
jgi:hypothetical protein